MQYSHHQMRTICSSASSIIRVIPWLMTAKSKRALGNVFAQLLLSACVLLVPPLLMVAGVMHLDSSPEGAGQQVDAERADKRPELAASLAPASVEQHPVISERRSVVEGPAAITQ